MNGKIAYSKKNYYDSTLLRIRFLRRSIIYNSSKSGGFRYPIRKFKAKSRPRVHSY